MVRHLLLAVSVRRTEASQEARGLTFDCFNNLDSATHRPSMEAQILRSCLILSSLFVATGANYQTPNFIVTAPDSQTAKTVGDAAEEYRHDLAVFWLDEPLPKWSRPCRLKVRTGSMGAGGETKFQFVGGEVLNWNMYVQGSLERILDSVLPHEVNHTIFACHYRKPLPRWADEGAATLFEHRSEQLKQLHLLNQVIRGGRDFISLRNLLTMKEYPKGYRPMLILYAEGYALADFLVQQGGRKKYLKFLHDGERIGWPEAIKANYHHGGVESLQKNWQGWVVAGMPQLNTKANEAVANVDSKDDGEFSRPTILDQYASKSTIRLQSPDEETGRQEPTRVAVASASTTQQQERVAVPARRTSAQTKLPRPAAARATFREASFEAPLPRHSADTTPLPAFQGRSSRSGRSSTVTAGQRAGLERTQLSVRSNAANPMSHREHLPQERNEATGSIPQWAGFPGQKELF